MKNIRSVILKLPLILTGAGTRVIKISDYLLFKRNWPLRDPRDSSTRTSLTVPFPSFPSWYPRFSVLSSLLRTITRHWLELLKLMEDVLRRWRERTLRQTTVRRRQTTVRKERCCVWTDNVRTKSWELPKDNGCLTSGLSHTV